MFIKQKIEYNSQANVWIEPGEKNLKPSLTDPAHRISDE